MKFLILNIAILLLPANLLFSQDIALCVENINSSTHGHIVEELGCEQDIIISPIDSDPLILTGLFITSGNIKIMPGNGSVRLLGSHHNPNDNLDDLNTNMFHGSTHLKPPSVRIMANFSEFEKSINIDVTPNPFKDIISIETNQPIINIRVYNQNGFTIINNSLKERTRKVSLDLSFLKPNTYILKTKLKDGNTISKLLVKQ